MPKKSAPPRWIAIKVTEESHALAHELLAIVNQRGWIGIESTRTGQHTLGAVLDESLQRLKAALTK